MSWTHALRQIVINCYKYHGREDLLPAFTNEDDKEKTKAVIQAQSSAIETLTGTQGVSILMLIVCMNVFCFFFSVVIFGREM